jgi:hypothetical protein
LTSVISASHGELVSERQVDPEKWNAREPYFERNAERMRYPKFRRQHLFVGSGVIQAGCKTSRVRFLCNVFGIG